MLIEGNFQGQRKAVTLDSSGQLAIGGLSDALTALGTITESGASFQLQGNATLSVSDVSSRVALPGSGGTAIVVRNNGDNKVYIRLTDGSGVALTSDFPLDYNCVVSLQRSTETYLAAICDTGKTASISVTVGSGQLDVISSIIITGTTKNNVVSESTFTASAVYINLETYSPPYTVSVYPGSGCTCLVKTCTKSGSASSPPASSYWEEWEQSAVTTATTAYINAPIAALEITRTNGTATCEYVVRGG